MESKCVQIEAQDLAELKAILAECNALDVKVVLNYKCNIVGRVELHDEAQFAQRDIHNTIGSNNVHSNVDVTTGNLPGSGTGRASSTHAHSKANA